MFGLRGSRLHPAPAETLEVDSLLREIAQLRAEREAVHQSYASIEFSPEGIILGANESFLSLMGYSLNEVVGKHHRLFVDSKEAASREYQRFWDSLARGESQAREFQRFTRDGRVVWLQAAYIPVRDASGKVCRVIKHAQDITSHKLASLANSARLEAISRSQAVIEFDLDGNILDANQNLLDTLGYRLEEIVGKHHRMFVHPDDRNSPEYQRFWHRLRNKEFFIDKFRRVSKHGDEVWLEASYNPIECGDSVRVVKFATEITRQLQLENRLKATGSDVAVAAEQMVGTITEISRNVSSTNDLASSAVGEAARTQTVVQRLRDSSGAIEKVVELIQDLADQTNLLALNATIEAARAGDAGRGFAVVAGEVKGLARQTGNAIKNIEDSVNEIREFVGQVVESSASINTYVGEMSGQMISIASAIEQQSMTMTSLSHTASQLRES